MENGQGAAVYDVVYRDKDYDAEAAHLRRLLAGREGAALLDVGCGTGAHLVRLRDAFRVEGLEKDPAMAKAARAKGLVVHEGDMEDFDLGRRFGVVTCLFSAIGYMTTRERLARAVRTMARHLEPDGLLVVEPWYSPDGWRDGRRATDVAQEGDLTVVRRAHGATEGRTSLLDFHHTVLMPSGVASFVTSHRLGLFTDEEYRAAFAAAGLTVVRDEEGPMARGLYVATMGA